MGKVADGRWQMEGADGRGRWKGQGRKDNGGGQIKVGNKKTVWNKKNGERKLREQGKNEGWLGVLGVK